MKKILLIIFVSILLIANISSLTFDTDGASVYDLFNNSVFNTSALVNNKLGSCTGGCPYTENTLYLRQILEPLTSGNIVSNNITTIDIKSLENIQSLFFNTYSEYNILENSYGWTLIYIFGNNVDMIVNKTGFGTTTVNNINRNYTLFRNDNGTFQLYINDTFIRTITPIDTNVSVYQYGQWVGSNGINLETRWINLFYKTTNNKVELTYPPNNYSFVVGNAINFQSSGRFDNMNITNATLLIYNSTHGLNSTTFVLSSGMINSTNISYTFTNRGDYNWNVLYCGDNSTGGGCIRANNNRSITINALQIISESYNNVTTSGTQEYFELNVTSYGGFVVNSAVLTYNGTNYSVSVTNPSTNNFTLYKYLIIPSVPASINKTFYWTITLTDGTSESTTIKNQTVQNVMFDNCAVNTHRVFNFTMRDEQLQNIINPTLQLSNARVTLLLYNSFNGSLVQNFSREYNATNSFHICMNSLLSNSSTYKMDVLVQYGASNYSTEYYKIQKQTFDYTKFYQNISLYLLSSTYSTVFKVSYKDANYLPVEDALISVQRYYIDEGVYKTVEQPSTDSDGNTLVHLQENDVIYNIFVYKNGNILASFLNQRAKCQNPVLSTCDLSLNSFASSIQPKDYRTLDDFVFTFYYNKTTRTATSIFNIPSGTSSSVTINATQFYYNTTVNELCSNFLYASTGTLNCIIPATFNGTVIFSIYKDGVYMSQYLISINSDPSDVYGGNLVFILIFMYLTLFGITLSDSPLIMTFSLILGSVIGIGFNLINGASLIGAGATSLYLIIAIIIIMVKGANR